MKLGKEETQKLVLGVLMAIGVLYGYFDQLLGPTKRARASATKTLEALAPKMSEARAQVVRVDELKQRLPQAEATLKQIDSMIPEGAPVAWFPPAVAEYFKRHGIEKVATRMNSDSPDPDAPGFRKISWTVDIPKAQFIPLGQALAGFENGEPLVHIDSITIEPLREEPDHQRASLTISSLVRK
jgi:hypothetical protein